VNQKPGGGEEGGGEGAEESGAREEHEVEGGAEESQYPEGAAGVVDEGVEHPEVLRRYLRKFEDDEHALEEDSSYDEDGEYDEHVLTDWWNYDFSWLIVNAGENVSWKYRENEVSVGAMYPTSEHLKDAMKRWATLTTQREFRVVKSSTTIYDVCCVKPDCVFRVHAYKSKWKDYFDVSIVADHICTLERLDTSH
jgi:hypothetical protein